MVNLLSDIGVLIILATMGGYVAKMLKQPLIPTYIVMGVLIGPVLGLVHDPATMLSLSEFGIAFLLFIVGLELDVRKLRDVGEVASVGGLIQAALMFGGGFLAGKMLGYTGMVPVYFGLVLSFSSTMVVIKMLSDKYELDTVHGRIVIGVLLLQDILAILALSALSASGSGSLVTTLLSLGGGVLLIGVSFLAGKWLFPALFKTAAKSVELLFLLAVSTCLFFSLIFLQLGFSIAVGAFIAGVILGNLPYNVEIVSRVKPLRDFFTVLFFTSIGLQMSFTNIEQSIPAFIALLVLTLVLSPLLTMIICSAFGYRKRTSFLTGLNLSQVSEFALILALAGLSLGHIDQQVFSLILSVTIVSIAASAYLIKFEDKFYKHAGKVIRIFEKISPVTKELENMSESSRHDVVLVGYDRTGYSIFHTLKRMKKDFIVVDFDPDVIRHLYEQNVPCVYGDIADPEVQEKMKFHQVTMVISTIPNFQTNLFLVKKIKEEHSHANIIVTSYQSEDALELYDAGADYVIVPNYLGGKHVSYMLEDITDDLDKLITHKLDHINELKKREEQRPKKHAK